MKKLFIQIIILCGFILASCGRHEDNSGNDTFIVSPDSISMKYYKKGKEYVDTYPFTHFKKTTEMGKPIPLFTVIDSAIIYNETGDSVISRKGESSSRNILLQANYYEEYDDRFNYSRYYYYIDSSYFKYENYTNLWLDKDFRLSHSMPVY